MANKQDVEEAEGRVQYVGIPLNIETLWRQCNEISSKIDELFNKLDKLEKKL